MNPVLEGGDVDLHHVSVLQGAKVRDAVTDHLVHGCAARLREAPVTEGRWVSTVVQDVGVDYAVQLVGGDPGADGPSRLMHSLAGNGPCLAHRLDDLRGLDVITHVFFRGSLTDIRWPCDSRRDLPARGDLERLYWAHAVTV